VIEQIAIGGTHSDGDFRRPLSGAFVVRNNTPGVPLRSTPGFIPSHPSDALIPSVPGFALGSQRKPSFQRRRRAGLKPGAEQSAAPGHHVHIFEPLKRGDGERSSGLGVGAPR
jgi:hypothetical protein